MGKPENGMQEYLNVSSKIGGESDCSNQLSDVEAVQRLLDVILRGSGGEKLGVPPPNGRFDALTGYHIFFVQNFVRKSRPGTIVDGCISPARGLHYGREVFTIVNLNAMAHRRDKAGWERVLDRFRLMNPKAL